MKGAFSLLGLVFACAGAAGCTPTAPSGAYQPRPAGTLTFNRDIAPIVFQSCSVCHHPGEAAPFSLLGYPDVQGRAKQIADATARRYMPPWLPKSTHGELLEDRSLTEDQIGVIGQWAREGCAEGSPSDLPPAPTWKEGWILGAPDLVLELPEPYDVPADGTDVYRDFVFQSPVKEPVYIRTFELNPDNRRVAHHAILMIDPSRKSRRMDEESPGSGFGGTDGMKLPESVRPIGGFFNSWNPGKLPFRGHDDMAWALRPGASVILQMHLQPSGKPEKVKPSIGLYFARAKPQRFPLVICLRSIVIDIPAGEKSYSFETEYTLPVDVDVLGVLPHAHYICKQMKGTATLPDGTTRRLIEIESWDFNWQSDYRYATPVLLPKGSRIQQRYTYDNSVENHANPHSPPVRVRYGPKSVDEMGELWIQVLPRKPSDMVILENDFEAWKLENENLRSAFVALKENPKDWAMLVDVSKTRMLQGRVSEAFNYAQLAVQAAPNEAEPHRVLGYLKLDAGSAQERQQAFEQLSEALRLRPNYPEALNDLGRFHVAAGDLDQAARCYGRAWQLAPDDPVAAYNLGTVAFEKGNMTLAADLFQRTLAIDPSYSLAIEALRRIQTRK